MGIAQTKDYGVFNEKKVKKILQSVHVSVHNIENEAMSLVKQPFVRLDGTDIAAAVYMKAEEGLEIPFTRDLMDLLHLDRMDLIRGAGDNDAAFEMIDSDNGMKILRAKKDENSASVIYSIQHQKELREKLKSWVGGDVIIIPTSKNEVVVEKKGNDEKLLHEMQDLLESINESVKIEDTLSANIYFMNDDGSFTPWVPEKPKVRYLFDMDGTIVTWRGCNNIEETYSPGYFLNRDADENILQAMKALRAQGEKVGILSAVYTTRLAREEKMEWLDRHGLLQRDIDVIFCPYGKEKHVFLNTIGWTNVLIDDYSLNLHQWTEKGMPCLKYYNGINGNKGTWTGPYITKDMDVDLIVKTIKSVGEGKV